MSFKIEDHQRVRIIKTLVSAEFAHNFSILVIKNIA